MISTMPKSYDPRDFRALTFHDAVARFRDGSDTRARIWSAASRRSASASPSCRPSSW
jgi:hypothetical protein